MFLPFAIVLLLAGYTGANIQATHNVLHDAHNPTEADQLKSNRNMNK